MKTVILSIAFGFVFFTIFSLVANVKPAMADGQVSGSMSDFCIHARMEAVDRISQGLHAEYGASLEKACGPLN